jgi:hypothetical protein
VSGKIFGIGLSKTGTTSLNQALVELGFKSIHYPQRTELFSGDFRYFDGYDAVTDIPVVPFYPQLDAAFLESKFILTVRDVDEWLRSMENWLGGQRRPNEFMIRMRIAVYGVVSFHKERLKYVYEKHVRDVKEYFKHRPADLLVMNICAGEGWEKLCRFLGKPMPATEFPFVVPGGK